MKRYIMALLQSVLCLVAGAYLARHYDGVGGFIGTYVVAILLFMTIDKMDIFGPGKT